jgi:hypothetical protein
MRDQLETSQSQARVYALEARWALHSLDGDDLHRNTLAAARFLSDNVYPFLRVRYTELTDRTNQKDDGLFISHQPLPAIQALLDVDWRAELYDQAKKVQSAGNAVKTVLDNAIKNYTPTNTRPVVLSIPRPSALADCDPSSDSPTGCLLTNYNEIDLERAARFWKELDTKGAAHFEIRPEDLYRPRGGNAVLSCTMTAPIVKNMQVFFNMGTVQTNFGTQFTAPVHGHGDLVFTTAGGLQTYGMANEDWLTGDAALLFGQQSQVESSVNALLTNPSIKGGFGDGLSPFTSFVIDMGYYSKPDPNPAMIHPLIAQLNEMVVVMETEFREVAAGVPYVGTCR